MSKRTYGGKYGSVTVTSFGGKNTGPISTTQIQNDWEKVAQGLERDIKEKLSHEGSGRLYYRPSYVGGGLYRASAPGEPPALRTGELRDSVKVIVQGSGTKVVLKVVTHKYGEWLEYGTSRIAPRPFARPAVKEKVAILKQVGATGFMRDAKGRFV